jgi:competence protein ComFA
LFKRYHNNPLPVPKLFIGFDFLLFLFILKKVRDYLKDNKYVFIFVPSIKEGEKLFKKFQKRFRCIFVFSSMQNKEEVMREVRAKKYNVIITTTILERGVTYKNLQVLVYKANEFIFNKETLIQIAGRAGRTVDYPDGDVYFLATSITKDMKEAIKEIKKYNDM